MDFLVLWLDCDREGENICFEVIEQTLPFMHKLQTQQVYRAKFSAISDTEIKQAMVSMHSFLKTDLSFRSVWDSRTKWNPLRSMEDKNWISKQRFRPFIVFNYCGTGGRCFYSISDAILSRKVWKFRRNSHFLWSLPNSDAQFLRRKVQPIHSFRKSVIVDIKP